MFGNPLEGGGVGDCLAALDWQQAGLKWSVTRSALSCICSSAGTWNAKYCLPDSENLGCKSLDLRV